MIVVDAAIALAWCLADEADDLAERVLDRVVREGAIAPGHWPTEVANGLRSAERRGRLEPGATETARRLLADLDVEIVPLALSTATGSLLALARRYGLTVYETAYLGLAAFRSLPLATLNEALANACRAEKVELVA